MNPLLDVTYAQHLDFLERVYRTGMAELDGFIAAQSFEAPLRDYSENPRLQDVYEQGFRDGKAKLSEGGTT